MAWYGPELPGPSLMSFPWIPSLIEEMRWMDPLHWTAEIGGKGGDHHYDQQNIKDSIAYVLTKVIRNPLPIRSSLTFKTQFFRVYTVSFLPFSIKLYNIFFLWQVNTHTRCHTQFCFIPSCTCFWRPSVNIIYEYNLRYCLHNVSLTITLLYLHFNIFITVVYV